MNIFKTTEIFTEELITMKINIFIIEKLIRDFELSLPFFVPEKALTHSCEN